MQDVLNYLRLCEYSAESFEEDNYGECTQDEIQGAKYEYMYLRNLADYLEIMMKKGKYSEEEYGLATRDEAIRMREELNSAIKNKAGVDN